VKLLGVEIGAAAATRGHLGRLLERNAALRDVFTSDAALRKQLVRVQKWQSKRLLRSHADLHADPRYRLAVEFFFNELYGGQGDVRRRDADLFKVQGAMERLLPREGLDSLCLAIQLETLSQELDADLARALPTGPITAERYAVAYRKTGRRADRERQIELTREIGTYLDGVVRKPLVRGLIRLARGPAHASGFGQLQEFLERGLAAFDAMHGADDFLRTVGIRELRTLERLFAGVEDPFEFGAARGRHKGDAAKGPARRKSSSGRARSAS
jgi:hypothetical protein